MLSTLLSDFVVWFWQWLADDTSLLGGACTRYSLIISVFYIVRVHCRFVQVWLLMMCIGLHGWKIWGTIVRQTAGE